MSMRRVHPYQSHGFRASSLILAHGKEPSEASRNLVAETELGIVFKVERNIAKHSFVALLCNTLIFTKISLNNTLFASDASEQNSLCTPQYVKYFFCAFRPLDLTILLL